MLPVEERAIPASVDDGLRPYQSEWMRAIWATWKQHRRVLAVLPSGAGKTVAYVRIVQQAAFAGERVLILVNRREILQQTYARLLADGLDKQRIGVVWQKDRRANAAAQIQLASIDTLVRRSAPPAERVVIDEAHHVPAPKFASVLEWYPAAPILGVTATPCRLDGKPLSKAFDALVVGQGPEKLVEQGWLARAEVWTKPGSQLDLKGLRVHGGDYEIKALGERMSGRTILGDITEHWKEHAAGRPTVAFCATVAQGERLCRALNEAGIRSELLTAETGDFVRRQLVGAGGRLERGAVKVVVTCDTVSEGWDLPAAKCAILARPTLSLARYLQQCARVLRPHGDVQPIILDHAGNALRFGLPHHDHQWSLDERVRLGSAPPCMVEPNGLIRVLEPVEISGRLVRVDARHVRCSCCAQTMRNRVRLDADRTREKRPVCRQCSQQNIEIAEALALYQRTVRKVRCGMRTDKAIWERVRVALEARSLPCPPHKGRAVREPVACPACGADRSNRKSSHALQTCPCGWRRRAPVGGCAACGASEPGGAGHWRKGLCRRCYMKAYKPPIKRQPLPCVDCGTCTMLSLSGLCGPCGKRRQAEQVAATRRRT